MNDPLFHQIETEHIENGHTQRQPVAATAVRGLLVGEALAFLLIAPTHLGLRIGPVTTDRIMSAAVAEAITGVVLAVSAAIVLGRGRWAWATALTGQLFALASVILGIVMIALGFGPHSALNDTFHPVTLVALIIGLALLFFPGVQAALDGDQPV